MPCFKEYEEPSISSGSVLRLGLPESVSIHNTVEDGMLLASEDGIIAVTVFSRKSPFAATR